MTAAIAPGPGSLPLAFFGVADREAISSDRIGSAVRQCLDPTEHVLAQHLMHVTALLRPFAQAVLVLLCDMIINVLLLKRGDALAVTLMLLSGIAALVLAVRGIVEHGRFVVVTDKRLMIVMGFQKTVHSIGLSTITDLAFTPVGGRITGGYGTLDIECDGDGQAIKVIAYFPASAVAQHAVGPRSIGTAPHWQRAVARIITAAYGIAALIASGVRPQARAEWEAEHRVAELDGAAPAARLLFALGLVKAALVIRAGRAAGPATRRLDDIARSEARTGKSICWLVFIAACYVFLYEGLLGVVHNAENLGSIGGGLYVLARWRRRVLSARDRIAGRQPTKKDL